MYAADVAVGMAEAEAKLTKHLALLAVWETVAEAAVITVRSVNILE